MNALDIFTIVMVCLGVIALPIIFYVVNEQAKKDFQVALQSIDERGFAIEEWHEKDRGPLTVCWGVFPDPIPLYIRISNRDQLEILVKTMSGNDIKLGDGLFDARFIVRSNYPLIAQQLLNAECRKTLRKFDNIEFVTGSINSVLSADHWPNEKKDARTLRKIWMVQTRGKQSEEALSEHIALGQKLAQEVQVLSGKIENPEPQDFKTKMFEGR